MPDPAPEPADAEQRARSALAQHPDGAALASGRFTVIVGGPRNHAWRVDVDDRRWFVRLSCGDPARLGADWASEAALLRIASGAGIAPVVRLADAERGLLVTDFVPGRVWTRADAMTMTNLVRIARLIAVLHGLEPPAGIRQIDFAQQALHYEMQLAAPDFRSRAVASIDAEMLRARAQRVFARLAATRPPSCLCHNDLHHGNVIDDGRQLWLVDWEYGGLGDPVFDLAGFISHHALDAVQQRVFIDAHGVAPGAGRLDDARWAYDYVQWLWFRIAGGLAERNDAELAARAEALGRALTSPPPGS